MVDLLPGFRFSPTEEELVSFYLHNKLDGTRQDLNLVMDRLIPVLDIYQYNPWQLPQLGGSELRNRKKEEEDEEEEEWFYFIPRQDSEARGGRPKRVTANGYWKATGSPGNVYSNNRIIGMKRTMVFYRGRAPNGIKTDWKMNEYKALDQSPPPVNASSSSSSSSSSPAPPKLRHEFSLCRVYKKTKRIRAFDRRPLGTEITAAPSDLHRSLPSSAQDAQNSPQSTSSDDHGTNPTQSSQENTTPFPTSSATEPLLLDWHQFNFYDGHDF